MTTDDPKAQATRDVLLQLLEALIERHTFTQFEIESMIGRAVTFREGIGDHATAAVLSDLKRAFET